MPRRTRRRRTGLGLALALGFTAVPGTTSALFFHLTPLLAAGLWHYHSTGFPFFSTVRVALGKQGPWHRPRTMYEESCGHGRYTSWHSRGSGPGCSTARFALLQLPA